MRINDIARVCHEVNRAYCASLGDASQQPWADAPQWQRDSECNGVRFHVGRLRAGLPPSPEASHENWLREKVATGWVYGPVKNAETKEHPCCVPYAELPREQQVKDALFVATVHACADSLDDPFDQAVRPAAFTGRTE